MTKPPVCAIIKVDYTKEGLVLYQSVTAESREIYIVITRTGTLLSKIIGKVSNATYNHASVSLDSELRTMYSFGRLHAYNPIIGGFVMEGPDFGTFKRFHEADAIVLRVPVTEAQYQELSACLKSMYAEKRQYHYNLPGLVLAGVGIVWRRQNWYYCSEFVRDILDRFSILDANEYNAIVKPEDFLEGYEVVYTGKLREYALHKPMLQRAV